MHYIIMYYNHRRMTQSSNLKRYYFVKHIRDKYQAAWSINSKCRTWIWSSHVSHDKHSIEHASIVFNNPISWLSSYMNIHNAIMIYVMCSIWQWRYSYCSWSLVSTDITLQVTMSDISFSVFTKREYLQWRTLWLAGSCAGYLGKSEFQDIHVDLHLTLPFENHCDLLFVQTLTVFSMSYNWLALHDRKLVSAHQNLPSTSRFASPSFAASPFTN